MLEEVKCAQCEKTAHVVHNRCLSCGTNFKVVYIWEDGREEYRMPNFCPRCGRVNDVL